MPRYINVEDALQAHPEFLNEQIDDHDKAIYAKGWNACNSAFYGAIKELPTVSPDEVRGVGKWDRVETEFGLRCPKCGKLLDEYVNGGEWVALSEIPNYCPNCGAHMEVSEDA